MYVIHYMYRTISLPVDLLDRVDEIIRKSDMGYANKTEFIKEAVRSRVLALQEIVAEGRDE